MASGARQMTTTTRQLRNRTRISAMTQKTWESRVISTAVLKLGIVESLGKLHLLLQRLRRGRATCRPRHRSNEEPGRQHRQCSDDEQRHSLFLYNVSNCIPARQVTHNIQSGNKDWGLLKTHLLFSKHLSANLSSTHSPGFAFGFGVGIATA